MNTLAENLGYLSYPWINLDFEWDLTFTTRMPSRISFRPSLARRCATCSNPTTRWAFSGRRRVDSRGGSFRYHPGALRRSRSGFRPCGSPSRGPSRPAHRPSGPPGPGYWSSPAEAERLGRQGTRGARPRGCRLLCKRRWVRRWSISGWSHEPRGGLTTSRPWLPLILAARPALRPPSGRTGRRSPRGTRRARSGRRPAPVLPAGCTWA